MMKSENPYREKYPLISTTTLALLKAKTSIAPFVPAGTIVEFVTVCP